MAGDEAETLARLQRYRSIMNELFERHDGRKVNTWGDAVIAEFTSVVEAARCAVEIQDAIGAENRDLPEARQMWFPHRHQSRRRHAGWRRPLRRRRQRRGAAGIARRSRRHHGVGDGVQPDEQAPRLRLRFCRTAEGQGTGRADRKLPGEDAGAKTSKAQRAPMSCAGAAAAKAHSDARIRRPTGCRSAPRDEAGSSTASLPASGNSAPGITASRAPSAFR